MKKKDPLNCPYCESEENSFSIGWSGSPEFFEAMKKKHLAEHCITCPTCGQEIKNDNIAGGN